MQGCDEPEDPEAVEVTTYDASQFKEYRPESLAVEDHKKRQLHELSGDQVAFSSQKAQWVRPLSLAEAVMLAKELGEGCYSYRQGGTGYYKKYPPPPSPRVIIDLTALQELKGTI